MLKELNQEQIKEIVQNRNNDYPQFYEVLFSNPKVKSSGSRSSSYKNFILVYGSLREGEYNYNRIVKRFGKDSFYKIGSEKLHWYKMYDLGDFPIIFDSVEYTDIVIADLMYCSLEVYNTIREMEENSGYNTGEYRITRRIQNTDNPREISFEGTYITVYKGNKQLYSELTKGSSILPLIKGGDWIKWGNEFTISNKDRVIKINI